MAKVYLEFDQIDPSFICVYIYVSLPDEIQKGPILRDSFKNKCLNQLKDSLTLISNS
jgi:hypothetical protein